MGGKASRTKGHNFERYIARYLRYLFPDARRGKQYTDGRETDVEGTPFRIQCKRQKDITWGDAKRALVQEENDAAAWKDTRPVVAICRADREKAYVIMRLSTAATIVERFFWRPEGADVIHFPKRKDDE
jgi:hypothetical protein